jgi:hypothetical protein
MWNIHTHSKNSYKKGVSFLAYFAIFEFDSVSKLIENQALPGLLE